MSEPNAAAESPRFILESGKPLSQSFIWKLQRAFFEQQGTQAWSTGTIPHYITSNPFIADAYARVVVGWLRDWQHGVAGQPGLSPDQPVYILEMGTGHGRFSYHFLKRFTRLWKMAGLHDIRFTYVMTDLAEKNISYWRTHKHLQPYVAKGMLDFARFDAENPAPLELLESGCTLSPETVRNPLVIFANYFFDSIPQDSFVIRAGQLNENSISVITSNPNPDLADPDLLSSVSLEWDQMAVQPDYYDDTDFNQILRGYEAKLPDTAVAFPNIALGLLRFFRDLSGGQMLLLSADKGHFREDELTESNLPYMVHHGSAFSLSVNYHALSQYVSIHGGQSFQPAHRHNSLIVCALLLGSPCNDYAFARQAYDEAIEQFGPDDFFAVRKAMEGNYENLSVDQLLAYFRLSRWDPQLLLETFPVLIQKVAELTDTQRVEIRLAVEHIWDTYCPIGEERDLPFHLGMLLYEVRLYNEAMTHFGHSLEIYGPNPSTYHNQGMCYYRLGRFADAMERYETALALDPAFSPAKAMKIKLQVELASGVDPSRK